MAQHVGGGQFYTCHTLAQPFVKQSLLLVLVIEDSSEERCYVSGQLNQASLNKAYIRMYFLRTNICSDNFLIKLVVQEKAPYHADAAVRKAQYEEAMAAYKVRKLRTD